MRRATIFVDNVDHPSPDYRWAQEWLTRWSGQVRVVDYATGGWEHMWDVEGPEEAIAEIPDRLSAVSAWSQQPYPPSGERKQRQHHRR